MARPSPEADFFLRGHATEITDVCWNRDLNGQSCSQLWSCDLDGRVILWNTISYSIEATLDEILGTAPGSILAIHQIHEPTCGSFLLVQIRISRIYLIHVESKKIVAWIDSIAHDFCKCQVLQRGSVVYVFSSFGSNGLIGLWKMTLRTIQEYLDELSSSNQQAMQGRAGDEPEDAEKEEVEDGGVQRDEVSGEQESFCVNAEPLLMIEQDEKRGMCMCIQARFYDDCAKSIGVIVGHEDGSVVHYDVEMPIASAASSTETPSKWNVKQMQACKIFQDPVFACAVDSRLQKIACVSSSETFIIASLSTFSVLHKTQLPSSGFGAVSFRPDDKLIFVGGQDGRIRVFSAASFAPLAILKGHKGSVTSFSFQSGSYTLASGSRDGRVGLWTIYSSTASTTKG
eukprot:ANDGO_02391.mRNA.1 Protein DECREASED SIZE EXCLUSION LIMIT 1